MMRRLLVALASFALTGCWYGIGLYAPADSRPVLQPGVYQSTPRGEQPQTYRVSLLPNGMTRFDRGEKQEAYGIAPLDRAGRDYVLWIPVKDEDKAAGDAPGEYQIYLLMVRLQGGEFRIYPPECKEAGADIAKKNGATVETGSAPACRFPSRASLETALRQLPRDEASAATLRRLP